MTRNIGSLHVQFRRVKWPSSQKLKEQQIQSIPNNPLDDDIESNSYRNLCCTDCGRAIPSPIGLF